MIFAEPRQGCRRALKAPAQRLLREGVRERGKRVFEAGDIQQPLVEVAGPHLTAMILLGINCGFGPKDCCALPLSVLQVPQCNRSAADVNLGHIQRQFSDAFN